MQWDEGISPPHLDIAASNASRIGVLAGPGTGKTNYGLMRRVARLLSEGVNGHRILLISFTRTAAQDLREKVAALGVGGADEVTATTLHAYCFGVLRRDAVLAITQRSARPLLGHEADLMLRDLGPTFGDIRQRRKMLEAFQAGWARGEDDHPGLTEVPEDKQFQQQTLRWLRHHKAMLIGEVVPLAYNYLSTNPLAEDLAGLDHIIVDEYQDLNFLEQRLLGVLSEQNGAALCIAGDDDQSIYGFRHANPVGIRNFMADPDVDKYEINVCGRSPRIVVSMANALMAHGPDRDKPAVECLQEADGDVVSVAWEDLDEEISGLVAAIATDIGSGRRQPGDILVLANSRQIGEGIRNRLREVEIDAHSFFTEEAVAAPEAQCALAMLRLASGDDPVSIRVLLGLGDANGRADAYRRLRDFCAEHDMTEREALDRMLAGEKLVTVPPLLKHYGREMKVLAALPTDDLPSLIDALMPPDQVSTAQLRAIAVEVLPEVETVAELTEGIVSRVVQNDVPPSPDYVRIMSLHKSKGLTSPFVIVAGLVHGLMPRIISGQTEAEAEEAMNEQRRLAFVAITRASEQIVLSYARSIDLALARRMGVTVVNDRIRRDSTSGAFRAPTVASPYLAELGPDAPRPERGTDWLGRYGS